MPIIAKQDATSYLLKELVMDFIAKERNGTIWKQTVELNFELL